MLMIKKKILKIVFEHKKIAKLYVDFRNRLNLKNKFRSNGCKVETGISIINGLSINNKGKNNRVIIGNYAKINNCSVCFQGDNNTVIVGENSVLNCVDFYLEDFENEITIGSSTHLFGKTHLAAIEGTKIKIGDNCLLSRDLHFRTGDSHSILNLSGERINPSQDIVIEDHVWIGTMVTCLKGVRVSKDSVVAATTTLCKNYNENNVIIAGVPGRIVKRQVNWSNERIKKYSSN